MRLAAPLLAVALATAMLGGCGGSSNDGSGATSTDRVESPAPEGRANGAAAPVGAGAKSCDTGSAGVEALRATGVSCDLARRVLHGWQRNHACASPAGASRVSCSTRSYRCLGARTDRGVTVSCSRPGRSIAFVAGRG